MDKVRIIEVKQSVFESNDKEAAKLRDELRSAGTYLLNVMSSPGSGKTTLLSKTINMLKDKYKIAVMEADIDSDVDAKTIIDKTGVDAIQIHTGGMCHLDAGMTRSSLAGLEWGKYDLIILENIGNLVCPAEFDTGASRSVTILSVPEGDDKPLKYPLMYQVCDLVLINKIDTLPVFDFDLKQAEQNVHKRNPNAVVLPVSAKTGEGVEHFAEWIEKEMSLWRK